MLTHREVLTGLGIHGGVEVDVGISEGAASDSVTAHTDGGNWSDLHWRNTLQHVWGLTQSEARRLRDVE